MRYPVELTPEANGAFSIAFPDVPEALTWGSTEPEAIAHAAEALESALDFYFETARSVPLPSPVPAGHPAIDLPASVAATVLLHNEMLHQNVRPAELARRLDLSRSEMTRLLNFRHNTRIDTIAAALAVLGKRLELQVL